ncbi:hypothetical protein HDU96_002963 [Phlyctochytrium bullatum]|nr:hypothetical protein HDU96_002963 [Phlyctochytrium bullatum]
MRTLWLNVVGTDLEDVIARDLASRNEEFKKKFVDNWLKGTGKSTAITKKMAAAIQTIMNELGMDIEEIKRSFSWAIPEAIFEKNAVIQNFLRSDKETLLYKVNSSSSDAITLSKELDSFFYPTNPAVRVSASVNEDDAVINITKVTTRWFKNSEKQMETLRSALNSAGDDVHLFKRKLDEENGHDGQKTKAIKID